MKDKAFEIISNEGLTFNQQLLALARLGEETFKGIKLSDEYHKAFNEGILCDLHEGPMPYRPRYICPNYKLLMEKGSKFLNLKPAKDLDEALANLLVLYHHVPSITSYPVYIGGLDDLLEEFVLKEDRNSAKKKLRLFLRHIDSCLTDSFVHANIGPKASVTGELVIELSKEMDLAVPNLTLKYDEDITADDFALKAIDSMLHCAKPSFANDKMFRKEWGDYAIASCYNGLKIGGGGFSLPRLRLYEASKKAKSIDDFLDNTLKYYADLQFEYLDKRVKHLVEDIAFFKSNFLVSEGFIDVKNFTGMFGVVGLAECVNNLLGIKDPKKGFGHNMEALNLGLRIMDRLKEIVENHKAPYCDNFNNRYMLHAQVGIDTDGLENSPGTRIPIGSEPEIFSQLKVNEKFHKYFPTGTGDIFRFEETYKKTPEAILDIIKGSFKNGLRYFSGYLENADVVRVTGYLVKKSEIAKLNMNKQSLNNVTVFGKGADDSANALKRRLQIDENSNRK